MLTRLKSGYATTLRRTPVCLYVLAETAAPQVRRHIANGSYYGGHIDHRILCFHQPHAGFDVIAAADTTMKCRKGI